MSEFLDSKHGKWIGRVYMLVVLFLCNAMIPIGAVMHYLYGMSSIVMILGGIGTAVCILILSTPTKLTKEEAEKRDGIKK